MSPASLKRRGYSSQRVSMDVALPAMQATQKAHNITAGAAVYTQNMVTWISKSRKRGSFQNFLDLDGPNYGQCKTFQS